MSSGDSTAIPLLCRTSLIFSSIVGKAGVVMTRSEGWSSEFCVGGRTSVNSLLRGSCCRLGLSGAVEAEPLDMVRDSTVDSLPLLVATDLSSLSSLSLDMLPLLTHIASPKRSNTAMVALRPRDILLPKDHDEEVLVSDAMVIASSSMTLTTVGSTADPLYRSPSTVVYP
jgi:hypothetical protein